MRPSCCCWLCTRGSMNTRRSGANSFDAMRNFKLRRGPLSLSCAPVFSVFARKPLSLSMTSSSTDLPQGMVGIIPLRCFVAQSENVEFGSFPGARTRFLICSHPEESDFTAAAQPPGRSYLIGGRLYYAVARQWGARAHYLALSRTVYDECTTNARERGMKRLCGAKSGPKGKR